MDVPHTKGTMGTDVPATPVKTPSDAVDFVSFPQMHQLLTQAAQLAALQQDLHRKEQENAELQRRLSQYSATTSVPGFGQGGFQRQLDSMNQQMAFKDQEVTSA